MIKDWNRREVKANEVFHFKNSLEPFICVGTNDPYQTFAFVNINENLVYTFDEILICYSFYMKEEDDDFLGVEVDGKIEWVDAE